MSKTITNHNVPQKNLESDTSVLSSVVRGQRDLHSAVHIEPLGMMIDALCFFANRRHELEESNVKVLESELAMNAVSVPCSLTQG